MDSKEEHKYCFYGLTMCHILDNSLADFLVFKLHTELSVSLLGFPPHHVKAGPNFKFFHLGKYLIIAAITLVVLLV